MTSKYGSALRSNRSIFITQTNASPLHGAMEHISGLGKLQRRDFEHFGVAGEIIYTVEGDFIPASQQDEEARIATLAHALKKLDNQEDAAEFMRCLNALCEAGDARYRQTAASHYYREIEKRGVGDVLKEMALITMHLASLNPITEEADSDKNLGNQGDAGECIHTLNPEWVYLLREKSKPRTLSNWEVTDDLEPISADLQKALARELLFDVEVATVKRMIRGRRKGASLVHDQWTEFWDNCEADGVSLKEFEDAFAHLEAMEQYDEGGAVIMMSGHERTIACGRIDPELSEEDFPERARHLGPELRRSYVNGVILEEIWEDLNAQIEVLFPIAGKNAGNARFFSHANRELQFLCREVLEAIMFECQADFHITALRTNHAYREFYSAIRRATDTVVIGAQMKKAYEARTEGTLPLKHFTALKTAAMLQRERLENAPLSNEAKLLIREVNGATPAKLKYLLWAYYGNNIPDHPIHQLPTQEKSRAWEALKTRKQALISDCPQRSEYRSPQVFGRLLPGTARKMPAPSAM